MIRTFTSYHHRLDQRYKDAFVNWAGRLGIIKDLSVNTGDIDDKLPTETIRRKIRDDYLRDSEVTVLLYGQETRFRKHVDWELKSTMINGSKNRKSGILVINLPTSPTDNFSTSFEGERELIYPDYNRNWFDLETKASWGEFFPNLPQRIVDNLVKPDVSISIVPWDRVFNYPDRLRFLLQKTALSGATNNYDTSLKMRMRDYNPAYGGPDYRTLRPGILA